MAKLYFRYGAMGSSKTANAIMVQYNYQARGQQALMVKPAMSYLDLVREVKDATNLPLAVYSVSGEYAMVKAASETGWIDEEKIFCEMAVSALRAGADMYITYYAKELARFIREGRIG